MVNLEDKIQFKKVPFSRLLKLELPSLAKLVMEIVEKHDPEELQIKEIFDLLVAEQSNIKTLTAMYGVHPLTLQLIPLRDNLMLYVSAIRFQLKVAHRTGTESIQRDAKIVQLAFTTYLADLRMSKNEKVIHEKIGEFISEVNSNETLEHAIDGLALTAQVDNLKATYREVRRIIGERLALISQRPKTKTSQLAKSVKSALQDLFKQIEVASLKHKDVNYQPLFDELNDSIMVYRNLVNKREALNKRKAEERVAMKNGGTIEKDDSAGTDTSSEESGVMGAPGVHVASAKRNSVSEVDMTSKNDSTEEADQSISKKEAAAKSGKDLQLPQVGNDDHA